MEINRPFILLSFPGDMAQLADLVLREFDRLRAISGSDGGPEVYSWKIEMREYEVDSSVAVQTIVPLAENPYCQGVICLFGEKPGTPLRYKLPDDFLNWTGRYQEVYKDSHYLPEIHWREGKEQEGRFAITGSIFECLSTWIYNEQHPGNEVPLAIILIGEKGVIDAENPLDKNWGMSALLDRKQEEFERKKQRSVFFEWVNKAYQPGIKQLGNFFKFLKHGNSIPVTVVSDYGQAIEHVSHFLTENTAFAEGLGKIVPFKGLNYYDETDSSVYFGKSQQIEDVLNDFQILWQRKDRVPFFGVLGGSGVGKSSFLRAGLIPIIKRRTYYGIAITLVIPSDDLYSYEQTKNPLLTLLDQLIILLQGERLSAAWKERFISRQSEDQAMSACELVTALLDHQHSGSKLVIAIDQFEYMVDLRAHETHGPLLDSLFRFISYTVRTKRIGFFYTCQSNRYEMLTSDAILGELFSLGGSKNLMFSRDQLEEIVKKSFKATAFYNEQRVKGIIADLLAFMENNQAEKDSLLPIISNTLELHYNELKEEKSPSGRLSKTESSLSSGAKKLQHINVENSIDQLGNLAVEEAKEKPGLWEDSILGELLRKLIRFDVSNQEQIILMRSKVGTRKVEHNLVESLKKFRLLFSPQPATIQLVHEAIIRHWKLANKSYQDSVKFLEIESFIMSQVKRWEKNDRADKYLEINPASLEELAYLYNAWSIYYNSRDNVTIDATRIAMMDFFFESIRFVNKPHTPVQGDEEAPGSNHFLLAVKYGHTDLVRSFLSTDQKILESKDSRGANSIYYAVISRSTETLDLIMASGDTDPNEPREDRWRPIHLAVNNGDREIVDKLLAAGADPLALGAGNSSILHLVCSNGDAAMFDYLIEKEFPLDFNQLRTNRWSPLMLACYIASDEIVRRLVRIDGIEFHHSDKEGWAAIHLACRYGGYVTLNELLNTGKIDLKAKINNGWAPLHFACRYMDESAVERLLREDVNINESNSPDKDRWKPIELALVNKNIEVVRLLLSDQRFVFQHKDWRNSLYSLALSHGMTDAFELLWKDEKLKQSEGDAAVRQEGVFKLINHADMEVVRLVLEDLDINIKSANGNTLMHEVIGGEHGLHKLGMLMERNPDLLYMPNPAGVTPLVKIIGTKNSQSYFDFLFRIDPAIITCRDHKNRSLLHLAVKKGKIEILDYLLKHTDLLHTTDFVGRTVLHYAAMRSSNEQLELLLDHYGDLEGIPVKDDYGLSPMHLACQFGNLAGVQLFYKYQLFTDMTDKGDSPQCTAVELVIENGLSNVLEYLIMQNGKEFFKSHCAFKDVFSAVKNAQFQTACQLLACGIKPKNLKAKEKEKYKSMINGFLNVEGISFTYEDQEYLNELAQIALD